MASRNTSRYAPRSAFLELMEEGFPEFVRTRGLDYYRRGKVRLEQVLEHGARAVVQGTESYRVTVAWEEGALQDLRGSCTCPSRAKYGPCKHLWAVLVALDAAGGGPSAAEIAQVRARVEELEAELEADLQDLERLDEVEEGWPRGSPRGLAPAAARTWRERMSAAGLLRPRAPVDPWPRAAREEEILYALGKHDSLRAGVPVVRLFARRRLRDGGWGSPRPLALERVGRGEVGAAEDRGILALLEGAKPSFGYASTTGFRHSAGTSAYELHGPLAHELLPRMAATGRLGWTGDEGWEPLAWDAQAPYVRAFCLKKSAPGSAHGGGGERLLDAELCRSSERIPLAAARIVFGLGFVVLPGSLARFDARGALDWVVELRRHGPFRIPAADAEELRALLARRAGAAAEGLAPLPVIDAAAPKPHLRLLAPGKGRPPIAVGRVEARVAFDYGTTRVEPESPEELFQDARAGCLVRRARAAEAAALARLLALGLRRSAGEEHSGVHGTIAAGRAAPFLRALIAEGWSVEAEGKRWRSALATSLRVRSGVDWFDLEGAVDFGEGQSASLPALLAAAREGRDVVALGDGSFGVLPERWLERFGLLALAGKAGGEGSAALRVPRAQAWLLDALLAAQGEASAEVDEGFARFRARLAGFRGIEPAAEPAGFRGELRGYQRAGLGWLAFLREFGLGGCLADDMGLGKTVQLLAHLAACRAPRTGKRRTRPPSLVVAPRSLIFNWLDEAARFTPELALLDYTGPERARRLEKAKPDVIVTTYGTLLRDVLELKERRFDTVVLDEAQAIKNAASQSAKAARLLQADHRLALSGTPVENHLGELWSLFEFLNPGMLGRANAFKAFLGGADRAGLGRALRPIFLRRTKDEVLDDLPPKSEQVLHCELEPPERKRYGELRDHYRAALLGGAAEGELGAAKFQVLEALLRLRQCACHPGLLDKRLAAESSAKLEVLLERLSEVAAEGHKALVFSQFTSLLAIVRARLDALELAYEYLDGRTRDRKAKVERFQGNPACPLFLISLKAGGQGLNLTAADYVFLLDPWWNPAVESQAIDRAHRIGRARPVFAYRLIAKDTVEERIQELQADQRALAAAIFAEGSGGESALAALTREELARLLA